MQGCISVCRVCDIAMINILRVASERWKPLYWICVSEVPEDETPLQYLSLGGAEILYVLPSATSL